MKRFEYQILIYQESGISSLFLGGGKVDPIRFANLLNTHGEDGWEVVSIERENRRMLLFWTREAMVVVMKKEKN